MPVEPFEPVKACFVCSKTPLSLEVNTQHTKLKDIIEKVVKNKLSVNSPLIMHDSTLLFETGDDLEEDIVASYAKNLDKTLAELPGPITNGAILTIEDLQQDFSCTIYIKHRDEFTEDEPDGMVLSGEVPTMASGNDAHAVETGQKSSDGTVDAGYVSDDVELIVPESLATIGSKRKFNVAMEHLDKNIDGRNNKKNEPVMVVTSDCKRMLDDDDVVVAVEAPIKKQRKKLE